MPNPLFEARIRAQRFWYRDGLSEIAVAIILLLQVGWLLVGAPGNSRSSWYVPATLIYMLLLVAFAVCAPRIMAAMRERITYLRGGYVHESGRKRRVVVGMVLALLAIVSSALALRYAGRAGGWDPARGVQWVPAVGGLTVGAVCVYVSVRQGLPRFLVVGVLSIILGAAVCIKYPMPLATSIWLAGVGCALLCSGGVALWNYLRTAPPAADET